MDEDAGITPRSGGFSRNGLTRCRRSRRGPSFSAAACGTVSRWTSSCRMRRAPPNHTSRLIGFTRRHRRSRQPGVSDRHPAPRHLDEGPIPLTDDGEYRLVMSNVRDVLKGRPGGWCLDCLVRHTRDRASDVTRQLDALAARFGEGRCGTCAEVGPVFFPRRGGMSRAASET